MRGCDSTAASCDTSYDPSPQGLSELHARVYRFKQYSFKCCSAIRRGHRVLCPNQAVIAVSLNPTYVPHVPVGCQGLRGDTCIICILFHGFHSVKTAGARGEHGEHDGRPDRSGQKYTSSPLVGRAHTRFLGISPVTRLEIVGPRGVFSPRF